MAYRLMLRVMGAASILSTVAATALILILAINIVTTNHEPVNILAFVATAFQLLSFIMLGYLLWRTTSYTPEYSAPQRRGPRGMVDLWLGLVLSLVAGGASLGTFVWTRIILSDLTRTIVNQTPSTMLISSFIIWLLSVLFQLSFFILIWLTRRSSPIRHRQPTPLSLDFPEITETAHNTPTASHPLNPFIRQNPCPSPPTSPHQSPTLSSLRSSLTIAVRPTSSKTKLLPHNHSYASSFSTTATPSHPRPSEDSAFDTWDTSSVSPQIRESVYRSTTTPRTGPNILSPIPGSRSPSPAKALEGPFFLLPTSPTMPPHPPRPTTAPHPSSPPPTASSFPHHTRPRGPSASAEDLPRARSFSAVPAPPRHSEDHIHPLFRTNSPTPPPSATPGTVVTAAPGSFEGLMINERVLSRMRSGSAPSSPSPLGFNGGVFWDAREVLTPTSPAEVGPFFGGGGDVPPVPELPSEVVGCREGEREETLGDFGDEVVVEELTTEVELESEGVELGGEVRESFLSSPSLSPMSLGSRGVVEQPIPGFVLEEGRREGRRRRTMEGG